MFLHLPYIQFPYFLIQYHIYFLTINAVESVLVFFCFLFFPFLNFFFKCFIVCLFFIINTSFNTGYYTQYLSPSFNTSSLSRGWLASLSVLSEFLLIHCQSSYNQTYSTVLYLRMQRGVHYLTNSQWLHYYTFRVQYIHILYSWMYYCSHYWPLGFDPFLISSPMFF